MKVSNAVVRVVLESPLHRLLSGSTDLVRYHGRRTGELHVTPTQYALDGEDIVILVARPETKTWWRNFRRPRDLDVLVAGRWRAMTGQVVVAADEETTGHSGDAGDTSDTGDIGAGALPAADDTADDQGAGAASLDAERLLGVYLTRFPKAVRVLEGDTLAEQARHTTLVWCRPRQ